MSGFRRCHRSDHPISLRNLDRAVNLGLSYEEMEGVCWGSWIPLKSPTINSGTSGLLSIKDTMSHSTAVKNGGYIYHRQNACNSINYTVRKQTSALGIYRNLMFMKSHRPMDPSWIRSMNRVIAMSCPRVANATQRLLCKLCLLQPHYGRLVLTKGRVNHGSLHRVC